ncbi:hypothetical protein [uncultured Algibacter sp.]|uniref:hypothetical protein n=1 Tax=uncultured Algibacter sp. TaxID=298659 RepID=UPI00260F9BA5|nr:hypothetical protein [uncultured Algibacter sp.]
MIRKALSKIIYVLYILIIFGSCAKDVDFEQARDYVFTPVIESSLVFFDEPAPSFLDSGVEIEIIQDFVFIEFFDDDFILDNLVKAEFDFETINSINRRFELRVDMLDVANQLQHTFTVIQEASQTGEDVLSSHIETFEDDSLQALKNTSFILFTYRLLPGPTINEDTPGSIQLKSKAVFYFEIEDAL